MSNLSDVSRQEQVSCNEIRMVMSALY